MEKFYDFQRVSLFRRLFSFTSPVGFSQQSRPLPAISHLDSVETNDVTAGYRRFAYRWFLRDFVDNTDNVGRAPDGRVYRRSLQWYSSIKSHSRLRPLSGEEIFPKHCLQKDSNIIRYGCSVGSGRNYCQKKK